MRAIRSSQDVPATAICRELAPGVCLATHPAPDLAPGQVLLDVKAAGVNRADALQLAGKYPPPPGVSDVPGLEVAGYILSAAPAANREWNVDIDDAYQQRLPVLALVPGGGFADLAAVDFSSIVPLPALPAARRPLIVDDRGDLAFDTDPSDELTRGAAILEACAAAWLNLAVLARIRPGHTILIHGGSGSVGTIAIQLAHHLGASVIATAGTPARTRLCRLLGAHIALDYHDPVATAVADYTHGTGVDVILDVTGAGGLASNLSMLAEDGTLLFLGLQKGTMGTLDLPAVMAKRAHLTGATLRSVPTPLRMRVLKDLMTHVWPLLEAGAITPIIDTVYPIEDCGDAFARLAPHWFGEPTGTYADPKPFGSMVIALD